MIKLGRINKSIENNFVKYQVMVSSNSICRPFWYKLNKEYSEYAVIDRCDAFLPALLFAAVSSKSDIYSDLPISKDLYLQVTQHIIPQLAKLLNMPQISLHVDTTDVPIKNKGMVGTGFSKGVDSLYTIMCHTDKTKEYFPRLTHTVVIHNGVFEGENKNTIAKNLYEDAKKFSLEHNLKSIFISSNIDEILPENYLEVVSFRIVSSILLLQKLFKIYLYSSGHGFEDFEYTRKSTGEQELYLTHYLSTSCTKFISFGGGVRRIDKIKSLCSYKPAYDILHPCFVSFDKNCGHCKKCRRDTVTLIALNQIDKFKNVYDVDFAKKNFDINVAFIIANSDFALYKEVLGLLKERNIPISKRSKVIAEQFKRGIEALKNEKTI